MPRVQNKRGTSANLASVNPTPLAGELVWDSTENAIKIGDGATAWTSLAYVTATPRAHTHTLSGLTDVSFAAGPVNNRAFLSYNQASGVWAASINGGGINVGAEPVGGWVSGSVGEALAGKASTNDARFTDARTPTDGSVTTAKIVDANVTYAKLQNVSATDRLLGRSSAGAGVVQEITCTAFGRSLIDDADAAAGRTTLGVAPAASPTFTGAALFVGSGTSVPLLIANAGTGNSFVVQDENGDSSPFLIDADGRVAIGHTTPTSLVELRAPTATPPQLRITSTGPAGTAAAPASRGSIAFPNSNLAREMVTLTSIGREANFLAGYFQISVANSAGTSESVFTIDNQSTATTFGVRTTLPLHVPSLTSTGVILADDAATANSVVYSFDGDTNTGIGRGGADIVTVVTAGSERVRVRANGRVDLGLPTGWAGGLAPLSASGDNDSLYGTFVIFDSRAAALGVGGAITFSGKYQAADNGARYATIAGVKETSTLGEFTGAFTISTNGGSGPAERVRVKSTGAVRFVPLASDPASGEAGDVYYNSTDNKLRVYNGTSWIDLH